MKHQARKRFGQNFLIDDFVIEQIVGIIKPHANDFMVEIGPGRGALTAPLLYHLKQLHVIELDRDLISLLEHKFGEKLLITNGDALKFDYSFGNQAIRVVGNLPYNISTPLLFHLASYNNIIDMHFMLQQEVVTRICATPHNKDYGRLSVMLQYKFACEQMLQVAKESFEPMPQVESAIIRLTPKAENTWHNVDATKLNKVVSSAFNQRRKTIHNSLKGIIAPQIFEELALDMTKRAENLSVDEYVQLAACI